jgi:FdhD protein
VSREKPKVLRKGRAKADDAALAEFALRPDPADPRLTERVAGLDQDGRPVETAVVVERPLTLFLNGQEIVTMMTIGDYPDYLAVGYLLNQNMLRPDDVITGIDVDEELDVVVVRTERETNYEEKLKKKVRPPAAPRARSSATSWRSSRR